MTIEEVENLRKDEMHKRLRFPKQFEEAGLEFEKIYTTMYCVYRLVDRRDFWERLITKSLLKKFNISVYGKGTKEDPYQVSTRHGDCKCFNIKFLFSDKKCPFQKGECFSNAFQMALGMSKLMDQSNCDCVSGIMRAKERGRDYSVLHSVVEVGNWVIDANFGIVISKDFYYKVFMFEELARVSGKQIEDALTALDAEDARAVAKRYNLKSYHLVFALEDLMDFVKNETRQENHIVFEELDYES